ncbi:hypothetical protein TNCV_1958281 [Trichonephila clavipes]|nr:hypothetical protein TNCV_1958281 [Trichonephila clavipes]
MASQLLDVESLINIEKEQTYKEESESEENVKNEIEKGVGIPLRPSALEYPDHQTKFGGLSSTVSLPDSELFLISIADRRYRWHPC